MKVKVIIALILITFSVSGFAKKKGFLASMVQDLKSDLLGTSRITHSSAEDYYNALTSTNPNDTASQKFLADTNLHVVFMSKLTMYDNRLKGFHIAASRYNMPKLINDGQTYQIFVKNIQQYRFIPMSDAGIKAEFSTDVLETNANVPKIKEGMQVVRLKMYLELDTAYTLKNGVKMIVGRTHKIKVDWKYGEDNFQEIAVIDKPALEEKHPLNTTIEQTDAFKCLSDYPFYKDEDWPRICYTITNFPEIYKDLSMYDVDVATEYFNNLPPIYLKATVWKSESEKIETKEFSYFPGDFNAFEMAIADLNVWGLGRASNMMKENTGYKRTSGPTPPQYPLPQAPADHKHFFDGRSNGQMFLADLLYKSGYDWYKKGDRRVWINIAQ